MAWLGHSAPPQAMADSQDRNLPATSNKICKARDYGQVASSRDLAHLLVVGGGDALLAAVVPMLVEGNGCGPCWWPAASRLEGESTVLTTTNARNSFHSVGLSAGRVAVFRSK